MIKDDFTRRDYILNCYVKMLLEKIDYDKHNALIDIINMLCSVYRNF